MIRPIYLKEDKRDLQISKYNKIDRAEFWECTLIFYILFLHNLKQNNTVYVILI